MGKPAAVMLLEESSLIASKAMLTRVKLMAQFIHDLHQEEFEDYWRYNYPGKAEPGEFLNYWVFNDLENTLVLGRKVTR